MLLGFDITPGKGISLISNVISELLSIPCSVLMGANLANEVSRLTTTVLDAFNDLAVDLLTAYISSVLQRLCVLYLHWLLWLVRLIQTDLLLV